jgi:hypothetical protein
MSSIESQKKQPEGPSSRDPYAGSFHGVDENGNRFFQDYFGDDFEFELRMAGIDLVAYEEEQKRLAAIMERFDSPWHEDQWILRQDPNKKFGRKIKSRFVHLGFKANKVIHDYRKEQNL